ncbi:exodeoxyribonuclease VII small subunit [Collinsella sp. AGMB00827]|uniref:Exodeoxyribonuclease VII small subunit n=1 Tax=Collinsella ureilytica TaxID=2869515 RepID=A0ABS7ML32_9ACTN|nr:exodeoxyribonuclease VII small subunit [Collinsella urealyticum]MBY4798087.1 exodeoxyribonuclease VII small subunit [Collinsella urealyticum]
MAYEFRSFDEITARLDEIISTVRAKDTSLERSLDLFDEAIRLGSEAVDRVDSFEIETNPSSEPHTPDGSRAAAADNEPDSQPEDSDRTTLSTSADAEHIAHTQAD